MCGILAGFGQNISKDKIFSSLLGLSHRGDEENQIVYLEHAFLAHTRLKVTGIQNGTQPLFNQDKSLWAVVNGEFYNYKKIRAGLEGKNHHFLTQTDSELLIHLYAEYGTSALDHLDGEFAFCLFDKKNNLWFLGRDPFGIRPLHYIHQKDENQFICASEAKALLNFCQPKLNHYTLAFTQNFQYTPIGETFFENISLVPPGHYLIVKNNLVNIHKYWNLNSNQLNISFAEAQVELKNKMQNAIEKRIPHEVIPCIHLSGGLDSSIIAGLLKQKVPDMEAFNISFSNDHYDESILAKKTSDFLNIKLTSIPVSHQDILKYLPQAVYMGEGLAINGHLSSKYILNQVIHKKGFKVALTGEGSDEFSLGYTHLRQDSGSLNILSHLNLSGIHTPQTDTQYPELEACMGKIPTWIKAKLELGKIWQDLFNKNSHLNIKEIYYNLSKYDNSWKQKEPFERRAALSWIYYGLSSYILKTLDDGMGMAHQIESRLPFLDQELTQFLNQIPTSYLVDQADKYLLRETFKDILHPDIYAKNKQPFMAPPLTQALINKADRQIMDTYVQPLFDNHLINPKKWKEFCKLAISTPQNMIAFEPILMLTLTLGQLIEIYHLKV